MSDSRQPAGEPVRQGEGADGFPTAVNIPCSSVEDCSSSASAWRGPGCSSSSGFRSSYTGCGAGPASTLSKSSNAVSSPSRSASCSASRPDYSGCICSSSARSSSSRAFSWRGSTLTPLAVRSPGRLSRVDGLAGATMTGVAAPREPDRAVRSDRSRRGGRPEQTRAGICHDCRNRRAVPRGACVRMVEPAGRGTQVDNGSLRGNLLRTGRTARWSPHRRAGTVRDRHLPRPSPRPLQRQPESDGSNGRGVLALPDRHPIAIFIFIYFGTT